MSELRPLLVDAAVLLGTGFLTLAVAGVARLPDVHAKIHAAAAGLVAGVLLVLLASTLTLSPPIVLRAALVGGFLLLTAPVGAHVLARLETRLHERGGGGVRGSGRAGGSGRLRRPERAPSDRPDEEVERDR